MEFRIQTTKSGLFEIIRTMPEVVGTFADEAMARKVMGFLVNEAMDDLNEIAQEEPAPVTPTVPIEPEPVSVPAPEPTPAPAPAKTKTKTKTKTNDWTEAELEQAFARLTDGEKLRDVADQFGKSWTVLRAKWARHKKSLSTPAEKPKAALPALTGDSAPPLTKVTNAIAELADQPECKLCGRHFEQTPDQLDLCARCTHAS